MCARLRAVGATGGRIRCSLHAYMQVCGYSIEKKLCCARVLAWPHVGEHRILPSVALTARTRAHKIWPSPQNDQQLS